MFKLIASMTAAVCLSSMFVVASILFDAMTTSASFARSKPKISANATHDECSLRPTWYTQMIAASLVSDKHRRNVKTSFQTNVDERLTWSDNNEISLSSSKMELANWQETDRGDVLDRHLDSSADSGGSTATVLRLSCGHHERLSPGHGCPLSISRPYSVCFHAAMCQRVCLQNVSRHDVRSDDDTRHHLIKRPPVDDAEISTAQVRSAGHEDMEKRAKSINVNSSTVHETSMLSDVDVDGVRADIKVSANAAVAKRSHTSLAINKTHKSFTAEKNTTAAETEVTSKTKASTNTCTAPSLRTTGSTKQRAGVVSSTGHKLSNLKKSDVDTKTTNTGSANQHDVTRDSKPRILMSSGADADNVRAGINVSVATDAKRSDTSFTTNKTQKSFTAEKNTTAAEDKVTTKTKASTNTYTAPSLVSTTDSTKQRAGVVSSTGRKLSNSKKSDVDIKTTNTGSANQRDVSRDSKPSTSLSSDADADNVHAGIKVSAAATDGKRYDTLFATNKTQKSFTVGNNAAAAEAELTTKTKASMNTCPAPSLVNRKTTMKPTDMNLVQLNGSTADSTKQRAGAVSSTGRKLSNSKKSDVDTKTTTGNTGSTNQHDVTRDSKPSISMSSGADADNVRAGINVSVAATDAKRSDTSFARKKTQPSFTAEKNTTAAEAEVITKTKASTNTCTAPSLVSTTGSTKQRAGVVSSTGHKLRNLKKSDVDTKTTNTGSANQRDVTRDLKPRFSMSSGADADNVRAGINVSVAATDAKRSGTSFATKKTQKSFTAEKNTTAAKTEVTTKTKASTCPASSLVSTTGSTKQRAGVVSSTGRKLSNSKKSDVDTKTTNTSANQRDVTRDSKPSISMSSSADADNVHAGINVSVAATDGKRSDTSFATNKTQTSFAVENNAAAAEAKLTTKTKASMNIFLPPSLVNRKTTMKPTDMNLVQLNGSTTDSTKQRAGVVSSTGRKLSNSKNSDVDTKITTGNTGRANQPDVTRDSKPSISTSSGADVDNARAGINVSAAAADAKRSHTSFVTNKTQQSFRAEKNTTAAEAEVITKTKASTNTCTAPSLVSTTGSTKQRAGVVSSTGHKPSNSKNSDVDTKTTNTGSANLRDVIRDSKPSILMSSGADADNVRTGINVSVAATDDKRSDASFATTKTQKYFTAEKNTTAAEPEVTRKTKASTNTCTAPSLRTTGSTKQRAGVVSSTGHKLSNSKKSDVDTKTTNTGSANQHDVKRYSKPSISMSSGADVDNVLAGINVSDAATDAKRSCTSFATNKTQTFFTADKNEDDKATKTTVGQDNTRTKMKASNNTCSAASLFNTTKKPTDMDLVQLNASTPDSTKQRTDFMSLTGLWQSNSKKSDVDKRTTDTGSIDICNIAKDSKSTASKTDSSNLPSLASAASGKTTHKEIGLSKHGETEPTDATESLASESTLEVEAVNDTANSAEDRQTRTAEGLVDDRENAEKHSMIREDDDTAASGHDVYHQYEQQLRSLEMKMLQLENQLLQSTVDRATQRTTTVELENYVMRLERELTTLSRSFVELKSELRQRNTEVAAATKDARTKTSVENDQSHKVAELTDLINNQSSLLVALRDKCSGLERDNRLLVERILNQSLMMNEMMLHVVALGAEQSKHTLQLLELSQVIKSSTAQQDQHSPPNHVETFPDPPFSKTHDGDVPKDCYGHYERGQRDDSVVMVRLHSAPHDNGVDVSVFCDMTHGGWTVIQRRLNGSVDFYRSWNDYRRGFGSVAGEYWLGNEVIHQMTSEDYSLRVSLTDWNDVTLDVDYDHFRVTDEADGYRLYVAGYRERAPSAGDSLLKHNGRRFSTFDVDNDQVGREFEHGSCARRFTGAWWYYRCYMSNLNGRYYAAGNVPDRRFDGIAWKSWTGSRYSLKRVEMKIRPARAGHD